MFAAFITLPSLHLALQISKPRQKLRITRVVDPYSSGPSMSTQIAILLTERKQLLLQEPSSLDVALYVQLGLRPAAGTAAPCRDCLQGASGKVRSLPSHIN